MPSTNKTNSVSISEILSFPNRIQNTLIFFYLFPVLLIFVLLSSYFYISTKNSLDEELGRRLLTVSQLSATQIKPVQFLSLQTTGIHGNTYQLIERRLSSIAQRNHIDRIYILDKQAMFLFDSSSKKNFGNQFERFGLHQTEIYQTFDGQPTASTLFKGNDGQFYKTAFTPIVDASGKVIAVVGVDGNATFFENLRELENRLIISGILFIIVILFISFVLSRKIVTPIELLALGAKRIGDGQIEKEIKIRSKNEVGFLAYVMDEMRKKILERDQSMQVMLRGIAHEVRNPLGGIELFSGILKEKPLDEDSAKAVDRIIAETENLKKLVEEFLHFAKKPAIQIENCDLQEFFEDLTFHWETTFQNNQIEWSVNHDRPITVQWDIEQMRRVFHNLIENAVQACQNDPKKLRVNIEAKKNHVLIQLLDNGPGISEENMKNLFKPFFTTKPFGNGLGLALAKKIIQAHGGDIEIESKESQGTTVYIVIPIAQT